MQKLMVIPANTCTTLDSPYEIDVERIFTYRTLRFACLDSNEWPDFDEKVFAPNAAGRSLMSISNEMYPLNKSTIDFTDFTPERVQRKGVANMVEQSVLLVGYNMAGHETHHRLVSEERYLQS